MPLPLLLRFPRMRKSGASAQRNVGVSEGFHSLTLSFRHVEADTGKQ